MGVHDVKKLSIFDEFSGKNPSKIDQKVLGKGL